MISQRMEPKEAVDYLTHVSWRESRLGLERMAALMEAMGNPQNKLKFVHIAGTNGKGSISAMLSSVLTEGGYRTGLYTSPYIHRFNERIQVNGIPISDQDLVELVAQVSQIADKMEDHPTEFELITAIAFQYFLQAACDIVVLEVGLGGRLDATNLIPTPEVAVIASIGLDHVAELGATLKEIAAEKAGIIKRGGDVVLYPQTPGVERVMENTCNASGAHLSKASFEYLKVKTSDLSGHRFDFGDWHDLRLSLLGTYQTGNAATALTAVSVLRAKGWAISDTAVRSGLADAKWPARFEVIHHHPHVVVDGGHNPQCVESILENLTHFFPGRKVTFLLGVMADKDYGKMVDLMLPHARHIVAVSPDHARALPVRELAADICSKGFAQVYPCKSVEEGVEAAVNLAGKEGVVCAFGSFYMAGAIRACFSRN